MSRRLPYFLQAPRDAAFCEEDQKPDAIGTILQLVWFLHELRRTIRFFRFH